MQNDPVKLNENDEIDDKVDEEIEAQGEDDKEDEKNSDINDTVLFDELKESLLTRKTSQRSEAAEFS